MEAEPARSGRAGGRFCQLMRPSPDGARLAGREFAQL
jgi:hypothetical protein